MTFIRESDVPTICPFSEVRPIPFVLADTRMVIANRTLAALAGLPPPPDIDGTDLSQLWNIPSTVDGLNNSSAPLGIKSAAFSQYPRCPSATNPPPVHKTCFELNDNMFGFMGYSIRVREWRCKLLLKH